MVSALGAGYNMPAVDPSEVRHGLIMDWLLRNKAEAMAQGHQPGLLNQALTADNYGPPMPAAPEMPSSAYAPSPTEYEKIKAYSSQPIQGAPSLPPAVRNKAMPTANTSVAASAPSGVEQEARSKSALNDLMAQLAAHRQIDPEEQRRQMWLNFFSGMAKSQSPTLIGSIAEGSSTLAPTMQAQTNARAAAEEKNLEDQIKIAQYEQDYGLKERSVGADEMRAQAFSDKSSRVSGGGGNSIGRQVQAQNMALRLSKAADAEMDPVRKQQYLDQAAQYQQLAESMRGGASAQPSNTTQGMADPLGLR